MPKEVKKEKTPGSASEGNESYLLGAIAYLLGILAIVLYLVKKDDKFVRFHSVQAILLNVVWFGIFILLMLFSFALAVITIPLGGLGGLAYLCIFPVGLVALLVMLYAAWQAFQGKMWEMPYIGKIAKQYA